MSSTSRGTTVGEADLEDQLVQVAALDLKALRAAWVRCIGSAPKHLSADLIRRRLAYAMQARAFGTHKPSALRRLAQLDAAFRADPSYSPSVEHTLTPGTVLVRTWRGGVHKVHVLEDGFSYADHAYGSLSEIATAITGAKWSGPAFFGLRQSRR